MSAIAALDEPSNDAFLVLICHHVLNPMSMTHPTYRHQHLPTCLSERFDAGGATDDADSCRILDHYPTLENGRLNTNPSFIFRIPDGLSVHPFLDPPHMMCYLSPPNHDSTPTAPLLPVNYITRETVHHF